MGGGSCELGGGITIFIVLYDLCCFSPSLFFFFILYSLFLFYFSIISLLFLYHFSFSQHYDINTRFGVLYTIL